VSRQSPWATGAGGTPVDPRIADRRDEVLRDQRRRLWRRLGVIAAVLVLCVGAVALTRSPLLDVERIEVEGAHRTGDDAVLEVLAAVRGTPMVDLDRGQLATELGELPWVEDARVQRRWPRTVKVRIVERTGVAVVPAGDARWQLVDATGRVLEEGTGPVADDLPVLEGAEPAAGPGSQVTGAEQLLAVALAVPPELEADISGIRFGRDGDLVLSLDPIGVVRLGDADRLADKMVATMTLLARVDDRCLSRIDVRVPAAPTITRVPDCARGAPPVVPEWQPPAQVEADDPAEERTSPAETGVSEAPVEVVPVEESAGTQGPAVAEAEG
jgi:cell division protein FtsQ